MPQNSPKPKDLAQARLERMDYPTDWVAIRTKYFISALVPKKQAPGSEVLALEENGNKSFDVGLFFKVDRPFSCSLYIGPLEYGRIKKLGENLDRTMNFGWAFIRPISKAACTLEEFLFAILFANILEPAVVLTPF